MKALYTTEVATFSLSASMPAQMLGALRRFALPALILFYQKIFCQKTICSEGGKNPRAAGRGKGFVLTLVCLSIILGALPFEQLGAQVKTHVDLFVSPSARAYNSVARLYGLWESIENQCGAGRSDEMIQTFGRDISRRSQANLEALAKGETRLVCVGMSPLQTQLLNGKLLNNANKRETVSCLYGIVASEIFLRQRDRNYFEDLVDHILFWQRFQEKVQPVNGFDYKYSIMPNGLALDILLDDPDKIGVVLTVQGGHALGHSVYIDGGISQTVEYENLVLANIDRLKGNTALVPHTDQFLKTPIFFIQLASPFENGITGSSRYYNDQQGNLVGGDPLLNKGFTELGKKVVKRLLDTDKGARILVDVRGMSVDGRDYYYKYLDRLEILGDEVPVVASSVGISGMAWKDPIYLAPDNDAKNAGSWQSNWQQNLGREDILAILRTGGIAGISLDEQVLGGGKYFSELAKTPEGSRQRRELQIKLFVLNLLRFVEVANNASAWDRLCLGSGFDAMLNPMESYQTSEQMGDLVRDVQNFLERPTDIFDAYKVADVRRLMFGLSGKEIADKVFSLNAIAFMKKHLGKGLVDALPPPSVEGKITFHLKGYETAKVVCLAGDFNSWIPNKTVFAKQDDGWVCRLNIPAGVYQYKFIIDGKWVVDPENPDFKDDGNGNVNSIITVK